jgi:hypothetical protein
MSPTIAAMHRLSQKHWVGAAQVPASIKRSGGCARATQVSRSHVVDSAGEWSVG